MVLSNMAGSVLSTQNRRGFLSAIGLFSLVSVAACATSGAGRSSAARGIEAWLRQIVDNGWVCGAAAAISGADGAALTRTHGHADREAGASIRSDTIYRIYSMTKPITAAAMLSLIHI